MLAAIYDTVQGKNVGSYLLTPNRVKCWQLSIDTAQSQNPEAKLSTSVKAVAKLMVL